jgi:hypothetical protein
MWYKPNTKVTDNMIQITKNGNVTLVKNDSSSYFICSSNEPDLTCTEPFVSLCMDTIICHRHLLNGSDAPINKHSDAKKECSDFKGYGVTWKSKPIISTCIANSTNYYNKYI